METGFDPRLNRQLTVAKYKEHYGQKLDAKGVARIRPPLICPACGSELHTVGETSLKTAAVWAHDPDKNVFCPIKDTGAVKYALLAPTRADQAAAELLRHQFFANWRQHWGFVRSQAPFAGIETFIGFIRHADRTNLWAHVGLNEWHLPYICLATCEFPPPPPAAPVATANGASAQTAVAAAARRTNWLRFRFDSKVRTIEDLWIRVILDLRFLRLHYKKPRSGEPSSSHYLNCDVLVPNATWMAKTFSAPHAFVVAQMRKAFPTVPGI